MHRLITFVGITLLAAAVILPLSSQAASRTAPPGRDALAAGSSPRPGAWTRLGLAQGYDIPTLVHVAGGNDLVVWMAPQASTTDFRYDYVEIKPHGGMASPPRDVFPTHNWVLSYFPALLSAAGKPLLVFEGARGASSGDPYSKGCIVGDLLTREGWKLQPWSLSADCSSHAAQMGATITGSGALSAAWAGGWNGGGNGVLYRIGVSPAIPAAGEDQHLSTVPGIASFVAEATETRTQDIYAAWVRTFSGPGAPNDAVWAADLSQKSPKALRVPGTGSNTAGHQEEPVALASPSVRGGVYVASCNDASPCSRVELWRYGTKKAQEKGVPESSLPTAVALAAGPAGRLWIAWWSAQNGTVRVVRTDEAGNRFGPVETYRGPNGCQGDATASIRISSGPQQRADVILTCYGRTSATKSQFETMATQSLVPLQIAATTGFIKSKKGGRVTYRVSDVGDSVVGATVTVDGKKATTDRKGQVTFKFPKGARKGSYRVVASTQDYYGASTSLRIA